MAAVSRLFRLSTFTVAAGAALKISKDATDRSRTKNNTPNSNLELVLVQIAFRHGARTPIFPAPCQELEAVTWQADLLMGALPYTDFDYELKHVSGGARPFSKYDDRQMKKILKVVSCLYCLRLYLRTVKSAGIRFRVGDFISRYPASRGPFDHPRKVGKRKIEGTSACRVISRLSLNSVDR